ncbi:MAG: hypothetical protein ACK4Y5_09435 [Acetobacteraceae bacterium]|jgi:hypothetical protein
MPLPIFIPFLIKGAIVAAKALAVKGAAAKVAYAGTVAVKTFGAATVASATTTGLVVTGAAVWTVERLKMVKAAVRYFDEGEFVLAANELTRIGRSIYMPDCVEFADLFEKWEHLGSPTEGTEFRQLIGHIRQASDEAAITRNEVKGWEK